MTKEEAKKWHKEFKAEQSSRRKLLRPVMQKIAKDWGKCTDAGAKLKHWCFSCPACRVKIALEILKDAYDF